MEKNNSYPIKTTTNVLSEKSEHINGLNITFDYEEQLEKQILQSLPQEALITSAKF